MEAIAKRAGVSKETLYRWWRSKTEVVLEALAERSQRTIPLPDTGSLAGDLRAFLRATVDSADLTTIQLLHAVAGAAAANPQVAREVRDRFLVVRRTALGELLARGASRGEIAAERVPLTIDMIYGSLWYRLIFAIGPLDYGWADEVAVTIAPPG